MKTKLIGSIISVFFFLSCERNLEKICDVSDPMNELSWLAEKKGIENISISKVILKDKEKKKKIEGFIIGPNKPYVNYIITYYNCLGEALCSIGGVAGNQCRDYEVIKEEIIYVTE
jgi:hypothetical protein